MEIPSKLTTNMLHGKALQSMNDIDSSRYFNLQGHGNLDSHNNSYVPSCSSPRKLDGIENIASLKPTVPGVKALSETLGKINPTTSAVHIKPDSQFEKLNISGSAAAPLLQRPAFQMIAPEEDLDDDDYNSSEPFVTENDKLESKTAEYETTDSVTAEFEKPLVSSAECAAACSSVLNGDVNSKFLSMSITSNCDDFSFPMAYESETSFQMAPMPTMPSSLVDRSSMQKEQVIGSAFAFGSREHAYELPKTTLSLNNARGDTTRPVLEFSSSKEKAKCSEEIDSLKASPSSLTSTSGSSVPSLNSGLISLNSSTAYDDGVMPFSNASEISVLSTSKASSTLSMPFILSTAPLFPTIVTNSPASSPILVSSLMDSKATVPEPIASKPSPFGASNSIASAAFPFLDIDKNSSLPASPETSSSMNGGISSVVTSSLFFSSGSDSSARSVASTPNIGNGIFGITASVQSINSTLSGSNNTYVSGSSTNSPSSGFLLGQPTSTSSSLTFSTLAVFPFGQSAHTSGSSNSQSSASMFGSSAPLPSTGISFRQSAPTSAGFMFGTSSSPTSFTLATNATWANPSSAPTSGGFMFGTSAAPAFSFTLAANATLANPSSAPTSVGFVFDTSSAPAFSFALAANATLANSFSPAGGVGTASPGHDQMDVEDSMADDTMQAAVPTIPVFAQEISRVADDTIQAAAPTIPVFAQANSLPASNFTFDSSTSRRVSVFQFPGQPTAYVSQGGSPFQAGGCLHVSSGGGFSLSTGDKSGRKVVRTNRNRRRKRE